MKALSNKRLLVTIGVALILLAVSAGSYLIYNSLQNKETITQESKLSPVQNTLFDKFNIIPLVKDSTGISPESEFKLVCEENMEIPELKKYLSISSQDDYKIRELSDREFLISFDKPLKPNNVYKFMMASPDGQKRSWAFQTSKDFRIVRTLPRDKATAVPLNSGIEITFSHENLKDFESHFEITPKVAGRFEYHGKTAVFVPTENMKKETIYKVTLKKGIGLVDSDKKTDMDYVFSFQIEGETTRGDNKYFSFSDSLYNYTSQMTPVLDVNVSDKLKNSEVNVDLYKYQNEESFLENIKKIGNIPYWAIYNKSRELFDTGKLTKVSSFKTTISVSNLGYWYMSCISFPEVLKEGHYLVNLTCEGVQYQTHLQINDTVLYINVSKNKSLIWANNSITGEPVEGALVETQGAKAVKTGNDGVAVITEALPLSQDKNSYYFKVKNGNSPSIYSPIWSTNNNYVYYMMGSNNSDITNSYWTYLFLDRGLYLPKDNVRTWGVVKPRDSAAPVSKATMQLFRYDYSYREIYDDGNFPVIDSKEIDVGPMGTFNSEMPLPDLNPGHYAIRILYDKKVVVEKSFTVLQYTKPAYKIDLTTNKKVAYAWDSIKCSAAANFFEGSPVSGLALNYNYFSYSNGNMNKSNTVTCDSGGKASFDVIPGSEYKSWRPSSIHINVSNAKAEEQEVHASENVVIFPRDTMVEAKGKKQGDKGVVEVKTHMIDISRIKDNNYYQNDAFRSTPVDIPLKAKVYESHYEKKEIGEYYDFINKKTEKRYQYNQVKNFVQELDIKTTAGKATFEFPYQEDNETYRHYYVDLSCTDGRGQGILETIYIYNWPSNLGFSPEHQGYTFSESESRDVYTYKTNEKVSLEIKRNSRTIPQKPKAKALYLTLRNGLTDYSVSESTKFETVFKSERIPNFYIQAIYFDGTYMNNAGTSSVRFDSSEKNLKINIRPDKSDYKPGDTVNLNVDVTDTKGNPVACELNFSVVDEANFALQDQNVDTLGSLYSVEISSGVIADYISVKEPNQFRSPQAECGEGGDAGIRSVFKDTAYFGVIKSDNSGKGKVSFKLPDNLTSWRVTYQGLSQDMKAGSGKINISCKLPYFVDTIFNKVFMEGDSPAVTVRSFGSKLGTGDDVMYNVLVEGDKGYKKTFTSAGKAAAFSTITLDRLNEGRYSITVEGKSGELRDAVKKDFNVVKSMVEISRNKYYKLTEGLKIEGGRSLTTLLFYNAEASQYYEALYSLMCSWGERIDQKMSRKIGRQLLKKYYDVSEFYSQEDFDLKEYQLNDGGIALLKYDSSNPVLTAKICSISTDDFDIKALKAYFYGIINKKESTPEDVAASYWGLSSLGEPILIDIQSLAVSKDMDDKNRLYLGLALAELGDYDGAMKIYSNIIQSRGKKHDNLLYIDGKDKDEILDITALCSMLSLKLNRDEKAALFNYVKGNTPSELLINLERMTYVANSIPLISREGSFVYELDGQEKKISVNKAEIHKLVLTKEKLEKIKFKGISGDISVAASFVGPANDLAESSGKLFNIERTYSVNNSVTSSFKQSDIIKIVIEPKFDMAAPDGYYEITDVLPAALRYVPPRYNYDKNDKEVKYPVQVDGQKVVFGFYYSKNSAMRKDRVVYYARSVCPGDFTADSAVIKFSDSDIAAFSKQQKIRVD